MLKLTVQRVTTGFEGVTGKNLHNVKHRRPHFVVFVVFPFILDIEWIQDK